MRNEGYVMSMDMGNFMAVHEKQVSKSDLIPYINIANERPEMMGYIEQMYPMDDLDVFLAETQLNKDDIYLNTQGITPTLVYVQDMCMIELPPFMSEMSFIQQYKGMKKRIENLYAQNDLHNLLYLTRKVYYTLWLQNMWEKLPQEMYRDIFKTIYQNIEYQHNSITPEMWERFATTEMDEDEKTYYDSLPNTLTIYRGETDKSTPYTEAKSWTLSKPMANFFATRYSNIGTVYQAEVNKEDVLAFFEYGTEKEVLVTSDKLRNIKKESVVK